jgi:hypothetical protein
MTTKLGQLEFEKDRWVKIISEAKKLCPRIEFKEGDFLKDLVTTVPLLNCDGDYYKWAHKSIQEYFAAQFICTDSKGKQDVILRKMAENRNVLKFINVLDLCHDIDYKTFRRVIIFDLMSDFLSFWNSTYTAIDRGKFSESVINTRKTSSFRAYAGFIRFENMMSTDGSALTREIVRLSRSSQINLEEDYSLWMEGDSPYVFLYFLHTIELLELLEMKGEDLFIEPEESSAFHHSDVLTTKAEEKIKKYLATHPLLVITDDPTSLVNDADIFSYVNWYIFYDRKACIDHEKARKLVEGVQREIAEEASDTFLTDNL